MSRTPTKSSPGIVAVASPSDAAASTCSSGLRPPAIPDHELLRRIGGGAYGEVWLARNFLGELRAVKVIHRSRFTDARPFEREFEGIQRFEPISRSHPSQLAILHVGKNDAAGCFYYVMELADGVGEGKRVSVLGSGEKQNPRPQTPDTRPPILDPRGYQPRTLRHDLDQHRRLPIPDCIQISLSLTTALAHLHQQGLVHRDIKPSNVIFVNGVLKLGDIGLVTEAGDTQSIVGTEGYLPPEGPGTPQADIFSLGKVLYEIGTGLDRRRFAELPEDLRSWKDRNAVVEFNEILLKACAKDLALRYHSAEELRADLELLQAGQSVKRRRAWQRTWDHAKKVTLAVGALAVIFAFVFSSGIWKSEPHKMEPSQIPEARKAYRDGYLALNHASDDGPAQAIELFKRAIELDPKCPAAYVRLAQAYNQRGITGPAGWIAIRTAVSNALRLDPKLSEAHIMSAVVKHRLELDWAGAESEVNTALKLNPGSPDTAYVAALCLAGIGRREDAVKMLEQAVALDPEPTSVARLRHAGHVYTWTRNYDKGIEKYNQVITNVRESRARIEGFLAEAYLGKGDYPAAIEHGRNARPLPEETPVEMKARCDALENALNEGGPTRYWETALQFEKPRNDDNHLMRLAGIYARLNRTEDALKLLNEAYDQTPTEFAYKINTDASFDTLRAERGSDELTKRLWRRK